MANPVLPRRSFTPNAVPIAASEISAPGELVINWADGVAYTKDSAGNLISWSLGAASSGGGGGGGGGGSFSWASVPASSTASGSAGDLAYDGSRLYVCTAANTWRAATLTRWDGDPYLNDVTFLMRFDGANGSTTFSDLSSTGVAATATGQAAISTAQAKFGQSLALNGFDASLTLSSYGTAFTFSGDFTIEAWVYLTSLGTYHPLIECRYGSAFADFICGFYNVNGTLRLDFVMNGYNARLTGTSTSVSLNSWTHVAWVRKSGTMRCYVNGVRDSASYQNTNTITPSSVVQLGRSVDPLYASGYYDEVRVTKAARYDAATFPVPTDPFPTS